MAHAAAETKGAKQATVKEYPVVAFKRVCSIEDIFVSILEFCTIHDLIALHQTDKELSIQTDENDGKHWKTYLCTSFQKFQELSQSIRREIYKEQFANATPRPPAPLLPAVRPICGLCGGYLDNAADADADGDDAIEFDRCAQCDDEIEISHQIDELKSAREVRNAINLFVDILNSGEPTNEAGVQFIEFILLPKKPVNPRLLQKKVKESLIADYYASGSLVFI
jgi:hypothetical protein